MVQTHWHSEESRLTKHYLSELDEAPGIGAFAQPWR